MFAPIQTSSQSLSDDFRTRSPADCRSKYDTAKMPIYRLQSAYLPQGLIHGVHVTVSAEGFISEISTTAPPAAAIDVERIDGIVVPGMPNAHSHAFQRAM